MAFCPNCGAQVEGRFCAKCGTAVGAAPPPAAASVPPPDPSVPYSPAPVPNPAVPPATAGMSQNVAAALCYLLGLVTGILFLVLEPYNRDRTIRFHAFQSIFLNLAMIAVYIVCSIIFGILVHISGLFFFGGILLPLLWLAWLVLWIYMMLSAYQGKTVVLPVIGQIARQQAGV